MYLQGTGKKQSSLSCYAVTKATDGTCESGIFPGKQQINIGGPDCGTLRGLPEGSTGFSLSLHLAGWSSFLTCISAVIEVAGAFLRTWMVVFTRLTLSPERHLCSQTHLG